MFYLSDILQLVIDRLYKSAFPQHNLVSDRHKRISHIALDFCHKLYSVHEQELKELFAYISLVTTEFTFDILNERLRVQWLAVIDIAGCEHEVQNLAAIIYYQV